MTYAEWDGLDADPKDETKEPRDPALDRIDAWPEVLRRASLAPGALQDAERLAIKHRADLEREARKDALDLDAALANMMRDLERAHTDGALRENFKPAYDEYRKALVRLHARIATRVGKKT